MNDDQVDPSIHPSDLSTECSGFGLFDAATSLCTCIFGFIDPQCSTNDLSSAVFDSLFFSSESWILYTFISAIGITGFAFLVFYSIEAFKSNSDQGQTQDISSQRFVFLGIVIFCSVSSIIMAIIDLLLSWMLMIEAGWSWAPLMHAAAKCVLAFGGAVILKHFERFEALTGGGRLIPTLMVINTSFLMISAALDSLGYRIITKTIPYIYRSFHTAMVYYGVFLGTALPLSITSCLVFVVNELVVLARPQLVVGPNARAQAMARGVRRSRRQARWERRAVLLDNGVTLSSSAADPVSPLLPSAAYPPDTSCWNWDTSVDEPGDHIPVVPDEQVELSSNDSIVSNDSLSL
eukprot:gnl/Dysnectes_brevis/4586_a6228_796.p1 GENE.gnl/Dysnectes_brevis/4586_a6228_796~~gnl/Dysnectes_brevis/4586_a6228_796.p1  ORF type:complete len:349 (-),score=32.24 gnl/Dysnectes_brevis/4586_a6228_796:64-1110(-)